MQNKNDFHTKINYDLFEDEEELDIVKLVSTDANDSNQYLLFLGSDHQYYAKNVSKIEELVVLKDLDIVFNNDNSIVLGTTDIRGQMLPLISFDKWMGAKVLDISEYELVIVVAFGGYKFGLVVKEVDYIKTIEANEMQDSSNGNSRSTFIAKVQVGNTEVLCTIVDSDKMILDTFTDKQDKIDMELNSISFDYNSDKFILFADDSRLVRKLIMKMCTNLGIKFKVLEDGQKLLDEAKRIGFENIALIVTDIEMPIMGGKEVIKSLRSIPEANDINIIIFTNMSNAIMEDELTSLGACDVVTKINVDALITSMKKYVG